jgi:hydrogenase-4 component H
MLRLRECLPDWLIKVKDVGTKRFMEWDLYRCTYCGRCAEVCPEKAVVMTKEYQLSTNKKEDLIVKTR